MMRMGILGILGLTALSLSGCILFDASHRTGPDEFGVVTRAPLSQPPDYALRPPRTGAERPNEVSPRDQARSELLRVSARNGDSRVALTNGTAGVNGANGHNSANGTNGADGKAGDSGSGGFSLGEQALLREADALDVDPDIRVQVDRESGRVTENESLVDTLVFWQDKSPPTAKAIDPKSEADRIKRNTALGVPPTATPPK